MILGALDDAGGQDYLAEQARENPIAFLTLLGRVLPREPIESPPTVITVDFGYRRPRPPALSNGPVENIIDVTPTEAGLYLSTATTAAELQTPVVVSPFGGSPRKVTGCQLELRSLSLVLAQQQAWFRPH
jgi:hypothetical protein